MGPHILDRDFVGSRDFPDQILGDPSLEIFLGGGINIIFVVGYLHQFGNQEILDPSIFGMILGSLSNLWGDHFRSLDFVTPLIARLDNLGIFLIPSY